MKTNSLKLAIAGVSISLYCGTAAAAYCPPQYQETWVMPMFANSTLVMNSALATVDAQLSALLQFNNQRVLSALSVLTKQKALSGNSIAENERKTAQQVANGLKTLSTFKQVTQAKLDYGPEFGQGYNPCLVAEERSQISFMNNEAQTEARQMVRAVYAGPGKYSTDISASKQQLLQDIGQYCTKDYAESGLCRAVSKNPGLALNAAVLFSNEDTNGQYTHARNTFINTIVGVPDPAVPKSQAQTPAARDYVLAKQQKDALISPALAALANVQAQHSYVSQGNHAYGKPVMTQYEEQVKRYFGDSEENTRWNQVLTAQTERGLLVEQLKMKALAVSIQAKQYKEYEVMEAQIAALTAQEIAKNQAATSKLNADRARADYISGSVK